MPTDRRARRTRAALRSAIVELILEKGYDAITVKDLLGRADIARSTFYLHYSSKEGVLIDGIRKLEEYLGSVQAQALESGISGDTRLAFVGPMLTHVESHRDLLRALTADGGMAVVDGAVRKMFLRLIGREFRRSGSDATWPSDLPADAVVSYLTDGFLSIMTWWLNLRPRRPAAEAERVFRRLMEPTLESIPAAER